MAFGCLPRSRRRQGSSNDVEIEKEGSGRESTEQEAILKKGTTSRRNAIIVSCFLYLADDGRGITYCSKPNASFWFNPVDILLDELLAGASIALPNEINDILNVLRIASHIMFGFFLGGIILDAILLVTSPIVLYSRWWSLLIGIISGTAAIIVVVAASLSAAISYIFQAALSSQPDLGVSASVGTKMLAFEFTAAGLTVLAAIIHATLGCCCTSRRDMRMGSKAGGKDAQEP